MSAWVRNRKDIDKHVMRERLTGPCYWNILWLFLYFAGIGFFLIFTPKYNDDHWFLSEMGDWFLNRDVFYITDGVNPFEKGMPWQEIIETIHYHYACDNARIGNMVVMPFLIMPKWIGSSICCLAWIYAVLQCLALAKIDYKKSPLLPIAIGLWYFGVPWQNHMGGLVFQFNYLIPSAIGIYIVRKLNTWTAKKSRLQCLEIFLLSVILGAWHEGFALPIIAGIVMVMICYKQSRNRLYCIAFAGMLAGVSLIVLAPSFSVRTGQLNLYYMASLWDMVKRFGKITLYYHSLILVLIFLEIVLYRVRGSIVFRNNRLLLFITASAIASIFVSFATTGSERSGWWCDLIVPVGILISLREVGWPGKKYSLIGITVCVVIGCLSIFSLLLTDYYTVRNVRECRKVISECIKTNKFQVYNDWFVRFDAPLAWFTKIDRYLRGWQYLLPPCSHNKYGIINNTGYINIVPESLRDITVDSGTELVGE